MKIVPAIDLIEGKCVRLTKGDYGTKKVYREDPVEVAKEFESAGIERLHMVDLDGAKQGAIQHSKQLERVASATNLSIDFGGGVKSVNDVQRVFDAGARMVCVGSVAIKQPETFFSWTKIFSPESFILGADVRNGLIAVDAWQETTDTALADILPLYLEQGVTKVLCTDISQDGTLEGPAASLYESILSQFQSLELIASGGVASMQDILNLSEIGVYEVVVGKAIYEGKITLTELEEFNAL